MTARKRKRKPAPAPPPPPPPAAPAFATPWLTLAEAANYARRGRRFLRREIEAGRLRAARIGGKREVLTRTAWIDDFLTQLAQPIELPSRRRA